VTIIVGIACKHGIVLASDSETTYGFAKSRDTVKVHFVEFSNGVVLIGESGNAEIASRALDHFRDSAKATELTDYQTAADVLQKAIWKVRGELLTTHANCSAEELTEIIRRQELDFAFLLAYFSSEKAYFFTARLSTGVPSRTHKHYAVVGCGADLGTYLLEAHARPNLALDLATTLAIYVVEIAKEHVAYCGGPVRVGILELVPLRNIYPEDEPLICRALQLPQDEVDELAAIIRGVEADTKADHDKLLGEQLKARTEKIRKELWDTPHTFKNPGTLY